MRAIKKPVAGKPRAKKEVDECLKNTFFSAICQDDIPPELSKLRQWVLWKAELKENGKTTKVPHSATGGEAKSNDSSTWNTFENVLKRCKAGGYSGIGYVFSKDDPFCGIDLDHCRNSETGAIELWAKEIIKNFSSYTEVSPSGTGIHIIVKGKLPEGGRKRGNVEIYSKVRYFTVTGNRLDGTPKNIRSAQEAIDKLLASHFTKEMLPQATRPSSSPCPSLDDTELIQKAVESRNGNKFDLLFKGLWENQGYPSQSEADQAFCNMLAFWTEANAGRMDAMFRQSGLMRSKWDKKHHSNGDTYGGRTIDNAISSCQETYSQKRSDEFDGCSDTDENVEGIPPKKIKLQTGFNAGELMTMNLPEPRWAVPDILPEGLNMFAGKPKMGKTVISLNIALAIASGGRALGKIDVEKGAVLYLALEDTKRRLQSRIKAMLQDRPAPENLHFETAWPKIDKGGLIKLNKRIREIPGLRLLIIDTLKKIRPVENGRNRNPYDIDYENVSAIKTLADKFNLCILLIHHLRKTESEDIMDDFSGTFGLTGAADGLLALKRKTGQSDAELHLIGRDVDAAEYALKYHPDIWTWELLGDAQEVKKTRNLQVTYNAIKQSEKALKPKEIAEISGVKYWTVTANLKSLIRDGSIQKTTYGEYRI